MNKEDLQSILTTAETMCAFYERCLVKTGGNKDLSLKLTEVLTRSIFSANQEKQQEVFNILWSDRGNNRNK